MLLGMWLLGLLVGWSLVYLAVEDGLEAATGTPLRMAALAEAGTGVVTMALAISYLPALYASSGRRESRLLTLDDPSGERIRCWRCSDPSTGASRGSPPSAWCSTPLP